MLIVLLNADNIYMLAEIQPLHCTIICFMLRRSAIIIIIIIIIIITIITIIIVINLLLLLLLLYFNTCRYYMLSLYV